VIGRMPYTYRPDITPLRGALLTHRKFGRADYIDAAQQEPITTGSDSLLIFIDDVRARFYTIAGVLSPDESNITALLAPGASRETPTP
jgi:hypothetical protein